MCLRIMKLKTPFQEAREYLKNISRTQVIHNFFLQNSQKDTELPAVSTQMSLSRRSRQIFLKYLQIFFKKHSKRLSMEGRYEEHGKDCVRQPAPRRTALLIVQSTSLSIRVLQHECTHNRTHFQVHTYTHT